jgi:phosphoglycerate dehydrogenase-like enzyme
MKAFIFDPLWDELTTQDELKNLEEAGIDIVVTKQVAPLKDCKELFEGDKERLLCLNPDYVSWKLTNEDYKDIPNLKGIMLASTGHEWVEKEHANQNNIPICQIVNFSTEAVAEWAVMIMFNLARQIPRLIKDGFPLDYDKDFMKYRGVELHGKTAGIIGMGHIGEAIAKRCAGLGMNVIYWSKNSRVDEYEYKELAEVIAEADVIYPILAKSDETLALFTPEMLQTIKPSALLIDMAHDLVDRNVMAEKIKSGKLFGYGYESKTGKFVEQDGNIWAAPAYGWATDSSMYNSTEKWVENMISAAKGEFPHRIN